MFVVMFCISYQKTKISFFVVCFPALLKLNTVQNTYTYSTGNDLTTFYLILYISDKSIAYVVGIGILHSPEV